MAVTSSSSLDSEKQRLGDRTRRRILDHAARLLRQKGYASTSLRDISAAAEMKVGSLYYHFTSKDDLVEVVLTEGIRQVETKVREAVAKARGQGEDALEVIRVAMIAHTEAIHVKDDYASANVRCFAHTPPEMMKNLRNVRKDLDDFWRELLAKARNDGLLEIDADLLTFRMAIIGMMNWTLEWRRPSDPSPAALGQQFYNILFRQGPSNQAT